MPLEEAALVAGTRLNLSNLLFFRCLWFVHKLVYFLVVHRWPLLYLLKGWVAHAAYVCGAWVLNNNQLIALIAYRS
jgi:hypothetical protein